MRDIGYNYLNCKFAGSVTPKEKKDVEDIIKSEEESEVLDNERTNTFISPEKVLSIMSQQSVVIDTNPRIKKELIDGGLVVKDSEQNQPTTDLITPDYSKAPSKPAETKGTPRSQVFEFVDSEESGYSQRICTTYDDEGNVHTQQIEERFYDENGNLVMIRSTTYMGETYGGYLRSSLEDKNTLDDQGQCIKSDRQLVMFYEDGSIKEVENSATTYGKYREITGYTSSSVEYDKNGNIIKSKDIVQSDFVGNTPYNSNSTTTVYNNDGSVKSTVCSTGKTYVDENNNEVTITETRDGEGVLLKEVITTNLLASQHSVETREYEDGNIVSKTIEYYDQWKVSVTEKYYYDNEGNLESKVVYNNVDNSIESQDYRSDGTLSDEEIISNGVTTRRSYHTNGKVAQETTGFKNESGNDVEIGKISDENGVIQREWTRTSLGYPYFKLEMKEYDKNGHFLRETSYIMDEDGIRKEVKEYNEHGILVRKLTGSSSHAENRNCYSNGKEAIDYGFGVGHVTEYNQDGSVKDEYECNDIGERL